MGQCPDYALLVVDAGGGVQRMTKEHLAIALALQVPTFVAITQVDSQSRERVAAVCTDVQRLIGVRCTVAHAPLALRARACVCVRVCAGLTGALVVAVAGCVRAESCSHQDAW